MLLGSPRLRLQQLLRMLMVRHMHGGIFGFGFLEIGIFAFDFDIGQWSGNEIPKVLVCILL